MKLVRSLLFVLGLLVWQVSVAQTAKNGVSIKRVLNGAAGQLLAGATLNVQDSLYFDVPLISKLDTPYKAKSVITFSINEYSTVVLPDTFSAAVNLRIYYLKPAGGEGSVDQTLIINYDTSKPYTMRRSFVFEGSHQVRVEVLGVRAASGVLPVLLLENLMQINPVYKLSCTEDVVRSVYVMTDSSNELSIGWAPVIGADVYDLEWTYVDQGVIDDGRYGNPVNPALVFENNTTRVTVNGNGYNIPLLYDDKGVLYYRVRAVQEREGYRRMETAWSSDFSGGLGSYTFNGHEPGLNWESSVLYAENGKRKIAVNYFDGSLRRRQVVNKDSETNTTIAGETFYDYQGRPAIEVMPAPTLNSMLGYAHNLNGRINGSEYDKSRYDSLGSKADYLTGSREAMGTQSGSNRYYSSSNPEKLLAANGVLPDAGGYAFAETEYMLDNTGRIRRQGDVGETFQLGSGHETKYYYNTASKEDLYALFGTEAGDNTHYFKNLVCDANGQYTVNYLDMHGRTIATALAGTPNNTSLENLSSMEVISVTDSLSGPGQNTLQGLALSSRHSYTVTLPGDYTFNYELDAPVLEKKNCEDSIVNYTALYDLQLRVTDDAYNQGLGGKPYDTTLHNYKADSMGIANGKLYYHFDIHLEEGSYDFIKTLTVSKAGLEYYRDSVFLPGNVCTSLEEEISKQLALQQSLQCVPDCKSCLDSIGDWDSYRTAFVLNMSHSSYDTAAYRTEAWAAFQGALRACNELCGTTTESDDIRTALLLDMTAPSGQYAQLNDSTSIYSIFHRSVTNNIVTYPYADSTLVYRDELGNVDLVYDENVDSWVKPQALSPEQFSSQFKGSWAECLLPFHPEYCRLKASESYRESEVWDRAFESVETYAAARDAGYLNPTDASSVSFTGGNADPFYLQGDKAVRDSMLLKLFNYNNAKGIDTVYTMWSIASSFVLCTSGDRACIAKYRTPESAFDEQHMCTGDLDMAWRSFRTLYLSRKREVVDWKIMEMSGCSKTISGELTKAKKEVRFTKTAEMLGEAGLTYLSGGGTAESVLRDSANIKSAAAYEANCRSYVSYWMERLSPCNYDQASLQEITEKLVAVCKEGSDANHVMGSSTLKPGSSYQYKSFETVLNEYIASRANVDPLVCNAQLITIPKPYDKQGVYSATPGYAKPDNCQCEKLAALNTEYKTRKHLLESFSGYIRRTRGVTISQSDLNVLLDACNGNGSSSNGCTWLSQKIAIPALIQCNVAPPCANCEEVNSVYRGFQTAYPDVHPLKEVSDTLQEQQNTLFANYMNNHLGFSKQAWEYLDFINDSCKNIVGDTIQVCKEAAEHGMIRVYNNEGQFDLMEDIVSTPDSGYLLVGQTTGCGAGDYDAYLIRTDKSGAMKWSRTYGGNMQDKFERIKLTRDSGFICIGTTYSNSYDKGAMMIVKFDKGGHVLWSRVVDAGTAYGGRGGDIIETKEGKYIFAGLALTSAYQGGDWMTGMLSDLGQVEWLHQVLEKAVSEDIRLLEDKDTLVLTGVSSRTDGYNKIVLSKQVKQTGNVLSRWEYDIPNFYFTGMDKIMKSSSGYRWSVTTPMASNGMGGIINLDMLGNVRSAVRFGDDAAYDATGTWSVAETSDGGLIVGQGVLNAEFERVMLLHKIDSHDSLVWSHRIYPENVSWHEMEQILVNSDGSYAGVGEYDNGNSNSALAELVVTRKDGLTGCLDMPDSYIHPIDLKPDIIRKASTLSTDKPTSITYVKTLSLSEGNCSPTTTEVGCHSLDSCYFIVSGPLLCGNAEPVFETGELNNTTNCSDSTYFAESAGTMIYNAYLDSVKHEFETDYIRMALAAGERERFAVTYSTSEYHYTLYYYDQAGNLVKTVPPAGVVKNRRQSWIDSVSVAKSNGVSLVPAHKMVSATRYNTLNIPVAKSTPDAGNSKFWYDRLGRLVASQNAQQIVGNRYSYTNYDEIGRITEQGELSTNNALSAELSQDVDQYNEWFNTASGSRREISRINYDYAYPLFEGGILSPANLRNRVSWKAFYSIADSIATGGYTVGNFYSYNIHGNLDTLLNDYKLGIMAESKNRFKKMVYNYDLITGNVTQFSYQPGYKDAFYHRYSYDADNKIVGVQTSQDGVYWESDAYYQYYKHGALSRKVLGQQQVQGLDYAYTLQGWLKGVNSTSLLANHDIGNDGSSSTMSANDVLGFSLHYFGDKDYQPINDTKHNFAAPGEILKPLYNGNISGVTQHIAKVGSPLLYRFSYDVLNRQTGMDAYDGLNTSSNEWVLNGLDDFKERIGYDENGNILSYYRNGNKTFSNGPLSMDSLSYHYENGTNRLSYVNDTVKAFNYDADIDDQLVGNYKYDAIGNLVRDSATGIADVKWTVYGKIAQVLKNDGTKISYGYDVSGNRVSKEVNGITTWYIHNATGNMIGAYSLTDPSNVRLSEMYLYGSERIGMYAPDKNLTASDENTVLLSGLGEAKVLEFSRGRKQYEITNHLGNILATVSDRKLPLTVTGNVVTSYKPVVITANDMYSGGMLMVGREYANGNEYRYSINGQEKSPEISKNITTAEFWQYDSRIVRRWNVDPKPNLGVSPYSSFAGNPVFYSDPAGDTVVGEGGFNKGAYRQSLVDQIAQLEAFKGTPGVNNDALKKKINEFKASIKTYDELEARCEKIVIRKGAPGVEPDQAWTNYNFANDAPRIDIGQAVQDGDFYLISHELEHVADYFTGNFSFSADGNGGILVDIYDEVGPNNRQSIISAGVAEASPPPTIWTAETLPGRVFGNGARPYNLLPRDKRLLSNKTWRAFMKNATAESVRNNTPQPHYYIGWKMDREEAQNAINANQNQQQNVPAPAQH